MKIRKSFLVMLFIMIYELGLSVANATGGHGYNQGGMMGHYNSSYFSYFMIGMMAFWFVIDFILAYIVYRDSLTNNPSNAILWAIIIFFTSFVGFVLYFLFRGTASNGISTSMNNPNITSSNLSHDSQIQHSKRQFCSICGTQIDISSKFCSNCGASTD